MLLKKFYICIVNILNYSAMITFSNKTRNGNFVFSDDSLVLYMNGSYSLKESNDLASISFSFGDSETNLNSSFNGYDNGNGGLSYNINCSDFVLLGKVMSVFNDLIAAIKANYTD